MRLGNLGKEKTHAVGLSGHCAACKGRCINRAWGFVSWISWEKGKGGLVLVRKGSLRKVQRRGETWSNCREAFFFHKNIDATNKRRRQHFKSNFLKMSSENYFCSAMIQWPAMLLNNGGTLSSYVLKKTKVLLKYRKSQNIIEQITKPKGNVTYKKISYLRSYI